MLTIKKHPKNRRQPKKPRFVAYSIPWAQVQIGDIPFANIEYLEPERPLWEYISSGGFILAVLALGFMSSRRVKDA